jgi:hypothetical protein
LPDFSADGVDSFDASVMVETETDHLLVVFASSSPSKAVVQLKVLVQAIRHSAPELPEFRPAGFLGSGSGFALLVAGAFNVGLLTGKVHTSTLRFNE